MCSGVCDCAKNNCGCSKICGILKLIMAGIVIGTAAGMVLMYFYDHDRWLQCKARKMINSAKGVAENIQSTIKSTVGIKSDDSFGEN